MGGIFFFFLLLRAPCSSDIHSYLVTIDVSEQDIKNLAKAEKRCKLPFKNGVEMYHVGDSNKPSFVCNNKGKYKIYTGDYVFIDEGLTGLCAEQIEYLRELCMVQVAIRDVEDRTMVYGGYIIKVE